MEKLKNEEERRKFQGNFEENSTNLETPSSSSNEHWILLKSCIETTADETTGYKDSKNIKKPWVTGKILEKMEGNGRLSTQKKPKETTEN